MSHRPHSASREAFQTDLDRTVDDELFFPSPPLERAGPVVVRKKIAIDGEGCTVWSATGPTLHVEAADVCIRNLRIECVDPNGVALKLDHPTVTLEDVTVRGRVEGLAVERGEWRYPHQLNLGALAHGSAHSLKLRIVVPVACKLHSEISNLEIAPRALAPGPHEVTLHIERVPRDTVLYGTISIRTTFLRREIALNAHVCVPHEGIPEPATEQNRVVWQPDDWNAMTAPQVVVPTRVPMKASDAPPPPAVPPPAFIPMPPAPPSERKGLRQMSGVLGGAFSPPVIVAAAPVTPPVEEAAPTSEPVAKPKKKAAVSGVLGGAFSPPVIVADAPVTPPVEEAAPTSEPVAKPKKKAAVGIPSWASPPPANPE